MKMFAFVVGITLALYAVQVFVAYNVAIIQANSHKDDFVTDSTDPFVSDSSDIYLDNFSDTGLTTQKKVSSEILKETLKNTDLAKVISNVNPFSMLGAYPLITRKYQPEFKYTTPNARLINQDDYCDRVDEYNLNHLENIFENKNFWTDFPNNQLPNKLSMSKLGNVLSKEFNVKKNLRVTRPLDISINSFFMESSVFHHSHQVGKHFLCATQMYNHIPGQSALATKDEIIDNINSYITKYESRKQCFNETSLTPYTYRLTNINECKAFFTKINSQQYKDSLKTNAIQFVIKVGHGAHKSQGVFLLDQEETNKINTQYNFGASCGQVKDSLLAQTYVSDPLLLDLNNKFDFRVYMLIASTNPLIAYYHDGFLKLSLAPYEKNSTNKGTHLTNTYLANQKIAEAKEKGELLYGMNTTELNKYILWDFEKLQAYLIKTGKVTDPNWLDNYLRPAFHRALVHLMRSTKDHLWKQSNVYSVQGVDFMLDNDLNLWFIESNPSPLLSGTSIWKTYLSVMNSHFEIQFAYYRSRMTRMLSVIKQIYSEAESTGVIDYSKYKPAFLAAARNRLEPEYQISSKNNFTLIMDENLPGAQAYFGQISESCL